MARIDHLVTSGTFSLDGETFDVDNNVWIVGGAEQCVVIDPGHAHPLVGTTASDQLGVAGPHIAQVGEDIGVKTNSELLTEIVDSALHAPRGGSAWDLYGGVGVFAAVAAEQVGTGGSVVSVEGNRRASQLAAQNLEDLPQVSTATADVTDWVRARRGGVDAVVLDPPRAGAGVELMGLLAGAVRQRIVYVSCEPATLARDLAALTAGGYAIESLEGFDLFPLTAHIETVTVLRR